MRAPPSSWLFALVLIAGLAGFAGFWYTTSSTTGVEPDFGGTYVEGMAGAPSRVNPLFSGQNAVDESLVALVFAGLTRVDERGRPFPNLAETWSISPDGREYVFTLRPGLVWHDGAPLTTSDVGFTYGLARNASLRTDASLVRALDGATVAVLDAQRIAFRLLEPFAPLPSYLTLGILPAHILGPVGPGGVLDAEFNQRPVGAGPYRLVDLSPAQAVMEANETYHFGHPFIQRIELRFFANEGLLLAALRNGELDGALFSGLAARQALQAEQPNDLTLQTLSTPVLTYAYLDLASPLFADRRVRQALLHALDRHSLIEEGLGGEAEVLDSLLAPGSWAYEPTLARYGYNPAVAALLLDEAGWPLSPGGVRMRGAQELAFRLSTNSNPVRQAVAQQLSEAWMALGVRVAVDAVPATTLVRDVLEPRIFEAALFSAATEADPDPYPFWHSAQRNGKGLNLASLRDQRFDTLIADARIEPSQPRRMELYGQLQELFAQEVPAIPLYAETLLYVQSESLRGGRIAYAPTAGERFWQVQEWHLKTR